MRSLIALLLHISAVQSFLSPVPLHRQGNALHVETLKPPTASGSEQPRDPVIDLESPEDHARLLEEHKDKLIVLKFFAPWCRACKSIAPKFKSTASDPKFENIPIVFAQISIQGHKEFVKSLGILALPSIQFYVNGAVSDTFPCGPSRFKTFVIKLRSLINEHVDPKTLLVKQTQEIDRSLVDDQELSTASQRRPATIHLELQTKLRENIGYLGSLNLGDFDELLSHSLELEFPANSVLMREGYVDAKYFYVILENEVEICQQTLRTDVTQNFLGTVINRLGSLDYFGERALITGEPRAASIRVGDKPVRLLAFPKKYFPDSSVLSGKTLQADVSSLDTKYGKDMLDSSVYYGAQIQNAALSNQVRGSVHHKDSIADTGDDGIKFDNNIFSLLSRFQRIRQVYQCFDYVTSHQLSWGDAGSRNRRSILVGNLQDSQRQEFTEIFHWLDSNGDGKIEILEWKRLLDCANDKDRCENLDLPTMQYDDYMGVMAEASFYSLFLEIFQSLDEDSTGYVKAGDLDKVLCGVRDLISDDRNSVIDVEDKEMLIDYETFARMLLGTSLV